VIDSGRGGGSQEGGGRAEYRRLLLDVNCLVFVEFTASVLFLLNSIYELYVCICY
jgi:hypothetical protein